MTSTLTFFRSTRLASLAFAFTATLIFGGCASQAKNDDTVVETAAVVETSTEDNIDTPAPAPVTETPAAVDVECSPTLIDSLSPNHPDTYTVVKGDTLWDISAKFLKSPWLWPEIWHINQHVVNPHLIYPGDKLNLVYINGCPQVQLIRSEASASGMINNGLAPRIRASALDDAINTVPYDTIASFISRPAVFSKKSVDEAPYILAIRKHHLIAGQGNHVYVRDPFKNVLPLSSRYNVYHIGDPIRDPDSNDILGYEAIYVASGNVIREGDPATLAIIKSGREALIGDRLFEEDTDIPLNFFPRAPDKPINGSIVSVIDGISLIGQYQVVAINRGAEHGVEPGHVFSVWQAGEIVNDRGTKKSWLSTKRVTGDRVQLPEERAGVMMVFRTYDRMSYGLIMEASSEMKVGDTIKNPTE